VFGQLHQPLLFKKISMKPDGVTSSRVNRQAMSEYTETFLVMVPPVVLFTVIGGTMLIRLLAGAGYWAGAIVIPWVAAADFLRAASAVVVVAFEIERSPRNLVLPMATVAAVTLSLTALLSPAMGIAGAGIALGAGSLVGFLLNQWRASRLECWSIPLRAVLKTVVVSVLIVGAAWLSSQCVSESESLLQAIVYVAVFGMGYMIYTRHRFFG
jgi:O-antigen/teichoic acid export membrane protein